jgi:hypothetical protein
MPAETIYLLFSFYTGYSTMAITSFDVDERTAALIEQLRETFGVKTNAAVIRKALALANVARQHANSDNTITIAPTDGGKPAVKISLAG